MAFTGCVRMRVANNDCLNRLKKLVEIGDQRITLVNGRFEDLAHALPDLVAQTERERHHDRMAKLRNALPAGSAIS